MEVENGRLTISEEIKALIRRMARENPLWREERIANELLLKLSIRMATLSISQNTNNLPFPGRYLLSSVFFRTLHGFGFHSRASLCASAI